MVRFKALVVARDHLEEHKDLLAVEKAEAKRLLRTHEKVNVKDKLNLVKYRIHILFFETPENIMPDPQKIGEWRVCG